jgi:uncharacterized delta-60 repeat protein
LRNNRRRYQILVNRSFVFLELVSSTRSIFFELKLYRGLPIIAALFLCSFFCTWGYAIPGQPGTLDSSFNGTGVLVEGSNGALNAVTIQPDGKAVFAGTCASSESGEFCTLRYNEDGTPDTSFGGSGRVLTSTFGGYTFSSANVIALQPDRKIVAAGICASSTVYRSFCAIRYHDGGTIDVSFGISGVAITNVGSLGNATARAMAIQSDGKIVVAGYCYEINSQYHANIANMCAVRYLSNGQLDASFGSGGIVIRLRSPDGINPSESKVGDVALLQDGRILLGGTCTVVTDVACAVRLNVNGSLDTTFNATGESTVEFLRSSPPAASFQALKVVVDADGAALLLGRCFFFNSSRWSLCSTRFKPDGALELGYGTGGTRVADDGPLWLNAATVQNDGKILAAGRCALTSILSDFCVVRYLSSGEIDLSFGVNGTATMLTRDYGFAVTTNEAFAVVTQENGRILLGGRCFNGLFSSSPACAVRYDGGLDNHPTCSLDIDGDGVVRVTTDSLLQIRVALGLTGSAVVEGIRMPATAIRPTWPLIRDHLTSNSVDFDGDGRVLALTDSLIHARIALGFSGDAVVAGIVFPPTATRTTWPLIRDYLVTQCGMSLVP